MRRAFAAIMFLVGLLPVWAAAQVAPSTLPASSVWGRLGISAGPGQAIPFTILTNNLLLTFGCTTTGTFPVYNASTQSWACSSAPAVTLANPSASIGLSAVNGTATTAMRSDGAPALSQSIAPTWTGRHIWGLTPVYDLASNVLGVGILMPLNSGTQTVSASKQWNSIRLSQADGSDISYTAGASSIVAPIYSTATSASGSDSTSNVYGGIIQATNAGPGTVKGIHAGAFGSGTSSGAIVGVNSQIQPVATQGYTAAYLSSLTGSTNDLAIGFAVEMGASNRYSLGVGSGIAAVSIGNAFYRAWMATGSASSARAFQILNNAGSEIAYWHKDGSLNAISLTLTTTPLAATSGGTGFASYAVGDILYADTTTSLAKLADVATGNALISGGVSTAPSWGKITSSHLNITTTSCSNQFVTAISAGGLGTCTTDTLASAQHANQGTTTTVLHGNASGNPSWAAVSLSADVSGQLPLANGGTNANLTASNGGIFYSTASAGAILAGTATANKALLSGSSTTPAWSSFTLPSGNGSANQMLQTDGAGTTSWQYPGMVWLATCTASTSATCDFTSGIDSTYDAYELVANDLVAATDDVALWLRVSTDGGSTWKATGYEYSTTGQNRGGAIGVTASSSDVAMLLNAGGGGTGVGNGSNKASSANIQFSGPSNTKFLTFRWVTTYNRSTDNTINIYNGGGQFSTGTSAINGVRLMFSSGNITSGTVALYGRRKSDMGWLLLLLLPTTLRRRPANDNSKQERRAA
jgi:hypothetical protein